MRLMSIINRSVAKWLRLGHNTGVMDFFKVEYKSNPSAAYEYYRRQPR